MRFRTQWAGSITTTAGAAYTIPTATMALGSGSAAAELVQATYVGTDPDYKVSANINAGAVEIRLSDETGALVAGTVHVVASRLAAWPSACGPTPASLNRSGTTQQRRQMSGGARMTRTPNFPT